jgi:hypothetical protein
MKHQIEKRLEDLERRGGCDKFVLVWADDEPQHPLESGVERIQLKWADDL